MTVPERDTGREIIVTSGNHEAIDDFPATAAPSKKDSTTPLFP
jgi:hypothetical protein